MARSLEGPNAETATAVRAAVESLDDRSGRFAPAQAEALRRLLASRGPVAMDHPRSLFGPWDELPLRAQRALRSMIEADIARRMDLFPHGTAWTSTVRAARSFDRFLADQGIGGRLRRAAVNAAGRLHGGPRTLGARWRRRSTRARWESGAGMGVEELLLAVGRGPEWLLGDFARGVRVDPRARGYFVDRARNVAWSYHVGLDLLVSDEGLYLVEANLEVGHALYPEITPNPIAERLVDWAARAGFRRLLWLEAERIPLYTYVLEDITREASRAGLRLDLLEDPCMPRRRWLPAGVPEPGRWRPDLPVPRDTLVFRRNCYQVGSDWTVTNKEPSLRALHARFLATGERRVRVPPMSSEPIDFEPAEGRGLPNLVYKFPDGFAGHGVFFMRARDREHAVRMARELDRRHGEPPGLFQRFVPPGLNRGRAYDIRTEILLSPLGVVMLTGARRTAGKPFTTEVDGGLVGEAGVFSSNLGTGGVSDPIPPDQLPLAEAASMAVGEAFQAILSETFVTE